MRRLFIAATIAAFGACHALSADAASQGHRPPAFAAIAARFGALGYSVTVVPRTGNQPYASGIVIRDIDPDTLHAFDVAVYRFRSSTEAKAHRRALVASFGRFPQSNQWDLEGDDLFVGSSASTELDCVFSKGKPHCKPFTFPHSRFEDVVAVAEGH